MAGTRKLTVEVLGDAKGVTGAFKQAGDGAEGLGTQFNEFGKKAALAFTGLTVGVGLFAKKAFDAGMESQKVFKQTEAIIKATGSAAGVTAGDIDKLATSISFATGQDDEMIMSSMNLLLTFKNLKNAAGEGNDIFNRTSKIMMDVANVFGSTDSAAKILGKALNDPANGLKALKKANVTFTDSEKAKIEAWQASGQLAKAQDYILGRLEKTVGGTAEATRSMSDVMKVAMENLNEEVGSFLIPIFERFAEVVVTKVIPVVKKFIDEQMPKMIAFFERLVDKIEPVIRTIAEWLLPILKKLGDWMMDNKPVVAAFFGAIAGVAVIASIVAVGSAIAALFSPIVLIIGAIALLAAGFTYAYTHFEVFRTIVDGVVRFVRDVAVPAIVIAFQWLFQQATAIFNGLSQWIQGWVLIIQGIIDVFLGVLRGDWSRAWEGLKSIVHGILNGIVGLARAFLSPILGAFDVIWDALRAGMSGIFDGLAGIFKSAINKALDIVEQGLNFAIKILNKALDAIDVAAGPWVNFGSIPTVTIPALQNGGIVTMPTLALIAENGPEAVIPLDRAGETGNQYNTIEISVTGADPNAVVEALKRYYRSNGAIPIRVTNP
jgi:hypothetical protein